MLSYSQSVYFSMHAHSNSLAWRASNTFVGVAVLITASISAAVIRVTGVECASSVDTGWRPIRHNAGNRPHWTHTMGYSSLQRFIRRGKTMPGAFRGGRPQPA